MYVVDPLYVLTNIHLDSFTMLWEIFLNSFEITGLIAVLTNEPNGIVVQSDVQNSIHSKDKHDKWLDSG